MLHIARFSTLIYKPCPETALRDVPIFAVEGLLTPKIKIDTRIPKSFTQGNNTLMITLFY